MKILTFDTSLDKTYVTLSENNEILSDTVVENHNEKYHSAFLIPTIVDILKVNNLVMQDIDVGVSSLEILSKINKDSTKTVVVLDARKNQYYTAIYENGVEVQAPKLTNANDVKCFEFTNAVVISDQSSNEFLKEIDIESIVYTDLNANLGLFLNGIVFGKVLNSEKDLFQWGHLKPLYLQAPPVTIKPNIPTT